MLCINVWLACHIFCGGNLVDTFVFTKLLIHHALECLFTATCATTIYTGDDKSLSCKIFLPIKTPLIEHLLRARTAVLLHNHWVFLVGVEIHRLDNVAIKRVAIAFHGDEFTMWNSWGGIFFGKLAVQFQIAHLFAVHVIDGVLVWNAL